MAKLLRIKYAQVIPEQSIDDVVEIYKDAVPYIRCQIQSTIQHEGGHREDEEKRNMSSGKSISFEEFSNPSRAEPIAEQREEDCSSLLPTKLSSETISINLNQLFEEAKSSAKINSSYKNDVKAGTLSPQAQGMYLMQDFPQELAVQLSGPNSYEGFDGTLWVDVRKIAEPYIVNNISSTSQRKAYAPDYQTDGASDFPGVSNIPPTDTSISATPLVPSIPGSPSIESRSSCYPDIHRVASRLLSQDIFDNKDMIKLNGLIDLAINEDKKPLRYFKRLGV